MVAKTLGAMEEDKTVAEEYNGPLPTSLHLRHTEHHNLPAAPVNKSQTQYSEHGHDLTAVAPLTKHSGSSVNTFFNGLFTTIIAVSTLGFSITFTFVLTPTVDTAVDARYNVPQVQTFLAISWLCFLLCLATAALGSTMLTFFKKHWIKDWDGDNGKTSQRSVHMYAVGTSALMGCLLESAFLFMCLVVVAYVPVVGWISLAFTSLFGIVIVVSVLNQVPWPWVNNTPKKDEESLQ